MASAGTKVFGGTQKTAAPVKQVKKVAAQAQATAKPAAGGLFGTRKVGPAVGAHSHADFDYSTGHTSCIFFKSS